MVAWWSVGGWLASDKLRQTKDASTQEWCWSILVPPQFQWIVNVIPIKKGHSMDIPQFTPSFWPGFSNWHLHPAIPVNLQGDVIQVGSQLTQIALNFLVLTGFTGWWLTYPSEKYEFVSWDDEIPNIWKVIKFMFQTTNQFRFLVLHWLYAQIVTHRSA